MNLTPLRRVSDSTGVLTVARLATLASPLLIGLIAWFASNQFTDLKAGVAEIKTDTAKKFEEIDHKGEAQRTVVWSAVTKLTDTVNAQTANVAEIKANLNNVTKTVDRLTTSVQQIPTKQ